jgi:hypothetical protein
MISDKTECTMWGNVLDLDELHVKWNKHGTKFVICSECGQWFPHHASKGKNYDTQN